MSDDFKIVLDFKIDGPMAAETMKRVGQQLQNPEPMVGVFVTDLKVLMVLAQCFLDGRRAP